MSTVVSRVVVFHRADGLEASHVKDILCVPAHRQWTSLLDSVIIVIVIIIMVY